MSVRVAFLECTGDLWLDLAAKMADDHGWCPVYWSGAERMQSGVTTRFPEVTFHQNTLAVKGVLPAKCSSWTLPPLDEPLLLRLSDAESIALRMMDRVDADGTFSYHERLRLYYRNVQWALAVIDRLRPEMVVCPAPPHLIYDYVLYRVCRLHDIRTMVFNETTVNGLIIASPGFEEGHAMLRDRYRRIIGEAQPPRLSPAARTYVSRLEGSYAQAIPSYVKELHDYQPEGRKPTTAEADVSRKMRDLAVVCLGWPKQDRHASEQAELGSPFRRRWRKLIHTLGRLGNEDWWQTWVDALANLGNDKERAATREVLQQIANMLAETGRANPQALQQALECTLYLYHAIETEYPVHLRCDLPPPETYLKQFAIPPEDSQLSYIEYWLFRSFGLRKKRELQREYDRLAQSADLSAPFVYVPLHYQPEASTSPLGGVFVDQFLMIEMLSKTLPQGWLLYVKEHGFQFDKKGSGDQTRALDFYRRVASLANVRFVPLSTSPFDLIDHAKTVATVTGTSGWEALLRGRPVLVFGRAWYLDCEGAFPAAATEDCAASLRTIEAGYQVNLASVHKFLQALEEVGFRGYTIPDLLPDAGVLPTENVTAFADVLRGQMLTADAA